MNKAVQGVYVQVDGKVYESVEKVEGKLCEKHCDLFICKGKCIDGQSRTLCSTLRCTWKELKANE